LAGVQAGNVYYYFKTKEALAQVVIGEHERSLRETFGALTQAHGVSCSESKSGSTRSQRASPLPSTRRAASGLRVTGRGVERTDESSGALTRRRDRPPGI
jgi:AcrR family transcriptional regulator